MEPVKMTITVTEERKQSISILYQNTLSNQPGNNQRTSANYSQLFDIANIITGHWKNPKYSLWLDLAAFSAGKLTSQRKH